MIHGLSDYEKLKVIRPMLGNHSLDSQMLPVMHKITEDMFDLETGVACNAKNLSGRYDNSNKIVLPFNYDKDLLKYWLDPMKYIPVLQTVLAVGTPDFSIYSNMNINEIRHNIYMNRWLGCLWQEYGINAIPVISWALPDTYDICFGGVEPGGIVMISTVGCSENLEAFYAGFYEMQARLKPSLIIVYGNLLPGIYGRLVHFRYEDAFNSNCNDYEQLCLFNKTVIIERKRGNVNGW